MDFSTWLKAHDYDEAALTPANRKHLELAWKADVAPPASPTPTPPAPAQAPAAPTSFDETMRAIEQENARIEHIREATVRAGQGNVGNAEKCKQIRQLGEAAIDDKKMDARAFDLALLRLDRTAGPMIFAPRSQPVTSTMVEAAVCRAGGLKQIESHFDARTLEDSNRHFRHGIGLLEMVDLCAKANGSRGRNVRSDIRGALKSAFASSPGNGYDVYASNGASTLDISGILSNVANKYVREAFMFVEDTWSRICSFRSVNDFKTISTYSLTGDLTYEKLSPDGEIKHGTLGETSYSNKADTYAKLLGIDRQQLINDDLGALATASRRLGRGGALKINDVFWTAFLDNSSFFTAGRGNYDDGATDTLLNLTGLANAWGLFQSLNDPDGKPTGTVAAILLVPPPLWPAAWTLTMSTDLNLATATAAATGTRSPWTGMFRLEQSRYLSNSSFTGYSAAKWYLLADPNDLPVIEVAFLNGQREPTIETTDAEFDRLGIAMRGYHDFGATKQEYRGGVAMKGEA